jgi:pimeloyl-ACP methyl ester carboxylesterase
VTMAACVEEVAAVRDGLGLHPFHVLGHLTGWLALEYAPKPPERRSRSCQVTVVRVASSPGGAGRSVAAGRVLFGLPSAHADVCDLTVGGSSGVVPAALSFAAKTDHDRA